MSVWRSGQMRQRIAQNKQEHQNDHLQRRQDATLSDLPAGFREHLGGQTDLSTVQIDGGVAIELSAAAQSHS